MFSANTHFLNRLFAFIPDCVPIMVAFCEDISDQFYRHKYQLNMGFKDMHLQGQIFNPCA